MKPKRIVSAMLMCVIVLVGSGCSSFFMKRQLHHQLSMDGRFDVEIVKFNAQEKTARVVVIDRMLHEGKNPPAIVCPYKYNGETWIADPSAVYRPRNQAKKD